MARSTSVIAIALLVCFSFVRAEETAHHEVEDLQPLVQRTETSLQKAKTHVEHMLNLSPVPNEEKIHPVVKNETEHLDYEIKKLATKLHEAVQTGEHQPELKEAVEAASNHLKEAAGTLDHAEGDLKHANEKYTAAAEKTLHEIKNILAAKPCHIVSPILKDALRELNHDVNNYQFGIHNVVGHHEGEPSHHHDGHGHDDNEGKDHGGHTHDDGHHHHHVHQHNAGSSEESKSSEEHSHAHN